MESKQSNKKLAGSLSANAKFAFILKHILLIITKKPQLIQLINVDILFSLQVKLSY